MVMTSPKAFATRDRIKGILTKKSHQFIFMDTPGLFIPQKFHYTKLLRETKQAIRHADVTLYLIDPTQTFSWHEKILVQLKYIKNLIVIINKEDMITSKNQLISLIHRLTIFLNENIP